ncbi:NnrS family protein [Qipengyuania gaetbuli]|uniref:NnrS family protein n=1 Tax=Qipengyuania gaetbuli TaxID=266952 RepID=UPI001CFE4BA9|nr:NnrS family protein [Qipengyuania gaetbuli]
MKRGPLIFRGAYRPFFLGAALWAIVALSLWLGHVLGLVPGGVVSDALAWHRHEMLFGFVGAAIAGFALTTAPNWTGRLPIAGWPLASLFTFWCLGRLLPVALPDTSGLLITMDGGFYIFLSFLIGREAAQSRKQNVAIGLVIAAFGLADIVDRLEMARLVDCGGLGLRAGIALVTLLISLVGGRIIPSFTHNWLAKKTKIGPIPTQPNRKDAVVLAVTLCGLLAWLLAPASDASGTFLMLAGIANFARLARWFGWRCLSCLSVFILHVAYLWLAFGLTLLGAAQFGWIVESAAIHALSTGAMATMILGVMSRTSLALSAHEPRFGSAIASACVLLTLAAVARVAAGFGVGEPTVLLAAAGVGWLAAFGLFLTVFAPILGSPRTTTSGRAVPGGE